MGTMGTDDLLIHWRLNRPRHHWREATCEEVGCINYMTGWRTILPVGDMGNIDFIRRSGLDFREEREDGLIVFAFAPGQECFTGQAGEHRVAVGRDPILTKNRRVMEPLEWMDNWNDHQYRRSVNG